MENKLITLSVLLVGLLAASRADIVGNLLQDASFDSLTGTLPQTNSSPWTAIEPNSFSIATATGVAATDYIRSGANSILFNYYGINPTPRFYQNIGTQIEAGKDYEFSIWSLLGDKSTNAAHTNSTTFNMAIYTSATMDGTYAYRTGAFNLLPTAPEQWEQFTKTFTAESLSAWQGEYMRVVVSRPNNNVEYRLYFDDASFGMVIPEPGTLGLIGSIAASLLFVRRLTA